MFMALQHAQVVFILKLVIVVGEGSSRLNILLGAPPLSLFDILFTAEEG
jgi:hypothetical protein